MYGDIFKYFSVLFLIFKGTGVGWIDEREKTFIVPPPKVIPASNLRKSTSGRHRPVSYPDGPMTARYRFT